MADALECHRVDRDGAALGLMPAGPTILGGPSRVCERISHATLALAAPAVWRARGCGQAHALAAHSTGIPSDFRNCLGHAPAQDGTVPATGGASQPNSRGAYPFWERHIHPFRRGRRLALRPHLALDVPPLPRRV